MRKQQITAFYLETLLLIVVFVGIILVLTRVFGIARQESRSAKLLTDAVCLAENAAEAVSASDSPEQLLEILDGGGNATLAEKDGHPVVTVSYDTDMTPDPAGPLRLDVTWEPSASAAGTMVDSVITARYAGQEEPVYSIRTAVFLREVSP